MTTDSFSRRQRATGGHSRVWNRRGWFVVSVCGLFSGCEPKDEGAPLQTDASTAIAVGAPGPGLVTNYGEPPIVSWPSPSFDRSHRTVPDDELREVAVKLASVVEWPSGKVVPGRWTTPEKASNQIAFERDAKPSGSWEAVVLDGTQMPKEFGGAGHVGPSVVYSPVSRPIVVLVNAARIMRDGSEEGSGNPHRTKGNDLIGVVLSEKVFFGDRPLADQEEFADWVQVETKQSGKIDCKPSWNLEFWPGPSLDGWALECPPLTDDGELTIRIKSSLKSSTGASLAESYSLSGDEDVTLEVTLPPPDPKEPATPREADKNSLLEQAGVPRAAEKTP